MNAQANNLATAASAMPVMQGWHDFVKSKDPTALAWLLHPDVVFESPVLHTPQHGRDITAKYLVAAVNVLTVPGFKYANEWQNEGGAVLEFRTEIEGITINGVDLIAVNEDRTLITGFKVMVRPLKAIQLLQRLMAQELGMKPALG